MRTHPRYLNPHAPQGTPPRQKTIRALKAQHANGLPSYGQRIIFNVTKVGRRLMATIIHPTKGFRGDAAVELKAT